MPCVYVENHRAVGLDAKDPIRVSYDRPIGEMPTGKANPERLRLQPSHGHDQTIVGGISRIGYMTGGTSALWVDEDMAGVLTRKAKGFIEEHASAPFFLYFATHDIHVPRMPDKRFVGKTEMGPRGDVIAELDWCVGEILETLDRQGLTNDTLIIFSSDNGPVIDDGYRDNAVKKLGDHRAAGPLRGGKYSAFEGGTRVPFLVRWPAGVKPGVSTALVCQIDLLASLASLVGGKLGDDDAPDSVDVLAALLGTSAKGRDHLVEHASVLSLRQGPWKFIEPGNGPKVLANTNAETGQAGEVQLYNLDERLGETQNVAAQYPDRLQQMRDTLDAIRRGTGSFRRTQRSKGPS